MQWFRHQLNQVQLMASLLFGTDTTVQDTKPVKTPDPCLPHLEYLQKNNHTQSDSKFCLKRFGSFTQRSLQSSKHLSKSTLLHIGLNASNEKNSILYLNEGSKKVRHEQETKWKE